MTVLKVCKVCDGDHDIRQCLKIHPLNRIESESTVVSNQEPVKTFIGATCCWCQGKHLGIDCHKRKMFKEILYLAEMNMIHKNLYQEVCSWYDDFEDWHGS